MPIPTDKISGEVITSAHINSIASAVNELVVNVKAAPYNATGDNVTDDTAAIQAAIDAVYTAGGGTVFLPQGNYRVTSLVKTWVAGTAVTVNIVGAGKIATAIRKFGAGTTPIFNFDAATNQLETYSEFRDFRIVGTSKAHDGIKLDAWAYWGIVNVDIRSCDKAIHNLGGLVGTIDRCIIKSNNIGLYNRLSAQIGGPPPNLITVRGTVLNGNSTLGIDHGSGQLLIVCDGSNIEGNGTAADTTTGGLYVQNTVDDAIGYAQIIVRDTWFESNLGRSIQAYAGDLILDTVNILSPESGRAVYSDGNRMLDARNVHAPSSGDTLEATANTYYAVVEGGVIHTVTLNSTVKRRRDVQGAAVGVGYEGGLQVDGLNVSDTSTPIAGGIFLNRASGDSFIRLRRAGGAGAQIRTPGTTANGINIVDDGGTGGAFIELVNMAAPASPAADRARLYVDEGGAGGANRLVVKWSDGSVDVLAEGPVD